MTAYTDPEQLRSLPFRTVFVEVSVELLAELMGQPFIDQNGDTIRMTRVDVRYSPGMMLTLSELVFTKDARDADPT